ncbi:hypothetical protein [Taklimakanibacter deserti]|uniref:hypothetical protein n=1 Tax=Taklimakanibacter deserti TaxID=2267839 RepID=UPI000E64A239
MLSACNRSVPVIDASGTRLPKPPSFMAPVPVQKLRAEQDARDALARDRMALKQANSRLRKSKAWYLRLRQTAAGK